MKKLLITAILLVSWSHHSAASNETLLEQCKSPNNDSLMLCSGLIAGFYQSYDMIQDYVATTGGMEGDTIFPFICWPKGVSDFQLNTIVIRYIETHPEDLHKHISDGIVGAFFDAFTCNEEEFLKHKNIEVPAK